MLYILQIKLIQCFEASVDPYRDSSQLEEVLSRIQFHRAAAFLFLLSKREHILLICCPFKSNLKIPLLRCVCGFAAVSRSIVTKTYNWLHFLSSWAGVLFFCESLVNYKALPCSEWFLRGPGSWNRRQCAPALTPCTGLWSTCSPQLDVWPTGEVGFHFLHYQRYKLPNSNKHPFPD